MPVRLTDHLEILVSRFWVKALGKPCGEDAGFFKKSCRVMSYRKGRNLYLEKMNKQSLTLRHNIDRRSSFAEKLLCIASSMLLKSRTGWQHTPI